MKAAEWTAALRSGKYEQGQNALCADGRFCCLGVLAEEVGVPQIDAVERIANGYDYTDDPIYKFEGGGFNSTAIPACLWPTFLEDLDLGMKVPETDLLVRDTLHNRLMTMNDEGSTFNEIADYIDEVANANQ
jgi:hypothetical protein